MGHPVDRVDREKAEAEVLAALLEGEPDPGRVEERAVAKLTSSDPWRS